MRSFAHVPLELGPRRFGVLTVAPSRGGRARRARAWRCCESLARPAAAAIANALEFQHERRIASALTRGFIPDAPPELEGFSLGLVYEPVGQEVSGGDVFGVWRQPDGALAVLVGDVSGKGIEVAAVSAMVRFFIEARTWDADCPAQVLAQANAILRRRLPGGVAMVTAFLGVIDGGVLRYANAGHVPPLVVEPVPGDGELRRAELPTTGLPLGVDDDVGLRRRASCPSARARCSSRAPTASSRRAAAASSSVSERVSALVAANAAALGTQALVELAYAEAAAFADELTDDIAIIALRPDADAGGRRAGAMSPPARRRREVLEHPLRPEHRPAIGAPADAHVVARAGVERQVALDRIPVVVLGDELVEVGVEAPRARPLAPARGEERRGRRRTRPAGRDRRSARRRRSRPIPMSMSATRSIQRGRTPDFR